MTTQASLVARGVARYAPRLHAAAGTRHHVASPLGAWLLLALAGPASTGPDRVTLTEVLGCDVDDAARAAADLLASPHPLVASAAAVWTARGFDGGSEFRRWLTGLPASVTTGDLPSQTGLDAWARDHTFGLIDSFPVRADEAYLLLATALATKVSWRVPFQLAPGASLGQDSPWAGHLGRVLRTPSGPGSHGHQQFIASMPDDGDVIVHAASAAGGLLVVSVCAAADIPPGRVLALAHDLGRRLAVGDPVSRRDVATLPLGDGPLWRVQEATATADSCTAVLPAWSASSQLDLADPALGFATAAHALVGGSDPWQARQSAMARYTRTGFEAAAVTGLALLASLLHPARHRHAELRFAHPYAVVALAQDADSAGSSPWHGLPVFSGWVSHPDEAADDEPDAPGGRL